MNRRWNVVLTLVANGPHQVTAITSMTSFPMCRARKPAAKASVAKKRIIRPATLLAAGLSLSA